MTSHGSKGQLRPEGETVVSTCPTCSGPLETRVTRSLAWAFCRPCRRLSRPLVVAGPGGAILVHPAAAA